MAPIHVVGIGLDGVAGLSEATRQMVAQATLLVGSARHLSYFPDHPAARWVLGDFTAAIAHIYQHLSPPTPSSLPSPSHPPTLFPSPHPIIILTSGDPLFFGLGRLLLTAFPPDQLTFHPHLSSIQLAFSRVKLPWQDAHIISAHGRSLDELARLLPQGVEKIAVLTDASNSLGAIARLLRSLDLPSRYRMWVCENLGGADERILEFMPEKLLPEELQTEAFAPLNVVILHRIGENADSIHLEALPLLGIPDRLFLSFSDRPGLMTKREIRILALGELALQPGQNIWDIGAGTGSVAIEMARLNGSGSVYAIEKTSAGIALIQQNCQRFQCPQIIPIQGAAPDILESLPSPDRIFIGGSGGNLGPILDLCGQRLKDGGRMVLALATLEHLTRTLNWLESQAIKGYPWQHSLLQVQLSRSVPIAQLTRLAPLNPVTLVVIQKGRSQ